MTEESHQEVGKQEQRINTLQKTQEKRRENN